MPITRLQSAGTDPFGDPMFALIWEVTAYGAIAASSAYAPLVYGLDECRDTTNRFRFPLPLPSGVAVGVALKSPARLAAAGTSEFSGVVVVGTCAAMQRCSNDA